jgi:hypothetical protein
MKMQSFVNSVVGRYRQVMGWKDPNNFEGEAL